VSGRRGEVFELLRAAGTPLGVADIAQRLDVHPNTVRFHLDALAADGRAERVAAPPTGPGRPPLAYRARPGMDPTGPRNYPLLAGALAGAVAAGPDPVATATEAGRRWGAQLVPGTPHPPTDSGSAGPAGSVSALVAVLDDAGFAPRWPSPLADDAIGLRHCPFLEVVHDAADVVCSLHLGLMRGVAAALDVPVAVERLEPFAAPDECLAHLSFSHRKDLA